MKNLLLILTIVTCCLFSNSAKASHIVGGEIYYDSLGNNNYKITIELFRDCGSATGFDAPLQFTIFYADGTVYSTYDVSYLLVEQLPVVYDDPCVTPPNDICIERAIYVDTVTLPFDPGGYYVSYQRCCWAGNIDNIVDPTGNGITLTTSIPGSSLVDLENHGARFVNYPPLVLCSGNSLDFDHHAFDPDGDSLVYSLAAPYLGGSSFDVTPSPESAAPYAPVDWNPGYSASMPFGAGSNIAVDAQTGMITFTPNLVGNYVAGVQVDEYREGILINSHIRTYGYRIVACQVEIPVEVAITGPSSIIEDCGFAGFIVSRSDSTEALVVQVLLSGTATNGDDYPYIEDTLIIPANVGSDTIGISAYFDGLTEGNETVEFNIIIENICEGTFDTTSISLTIIDYLAMTITSTDSINLCSEMGQTAFINCHVENGVPTYLYDWNPGNWATNVDSIYITGAVLDPNLNIFTVTVYDVCGKTIESAPIRVYEQCPITAPNFITMNGDGTNDAFYVNNLDNFDKVSLTIVNRWGSVVYENDDYKNDWKGLDVSGKQLNEGVYFYTITPVSEKYEYDDVDETLYTIQGFVHLISNK
jgi:gliding motility-associated-like protein